MSSDPGAESPFTGGPARANGPPAGSAHPPDWPLPDLQAPDGAWQEAINAGPRGMGRQIACALAFSRERPPAEGPPAADSAGAIPPESWDGPAALALAALGEQLPLDERIALLDDTQTLADPAARAGGLLRLAPALPDEQRRQALRDAYAAACQASPAARGRLLADLLPLLHHPAEN